MILLTLNNISKSFVMNRVLTEVNLSLPEGSRMGLVGVNGSGKSTLFQIIAGLQQPDEGTVSLIVGFFNISKKDHFCFSCPGGARAKSTAFLRSVTEF